MSNENLWKLFELAIGVFFLFSCISYPFEIFPGVFQDIINLNPLYYVFDFLRLVWIENNPIISVSSHFTSFFILIICSIIIPTLSIFLFNRLYKKFGIAGY
jgi:ABC-type polysaccharide/polyol phosphate export permease